MNSSESEYLFGLNKAVRYCSYRDRCESEVLQKMTEWDLCESVRDRVIDELKREKYLDDNRFAKIYAGSKFRVNGWGKIKIRAHLSMKRISKSVVNEAIGTLDENEYQEKLEHLLRKKHAETKGPNDHKKRIKVMNYGRSKGYENDLIFDVVDQIFKE